MPQRVFFVTGTSSGFGASLTQEILDKGDRVVATARDPKKLKFSNASPDNYLPLSLDVTDPASINQAFNDALSKFGRVDVVINNAGYGLCGPFEELEESQIRHQMEVNFFAVINVTRKAMQVLRTQTPSGGLIQQISSMGGQKGMPTFSIYCASKWAIEGFTEAVSQEVKPEWGIKFASVQPGGFRTNWAGGSMVFPKQRLPEYDHFDAEEHMNKRHGTQLGDPEKAGKALYQLAVMDKPPIRVALGSDSQQIVMKKLEVYGQIYREFADFSKITDIEGAA